LQAQQLYAQYGFGKRKELAARMRAALPADKLELAEKMAKRRAEMGMGEEEEEEEEEGGM
jgi:hypothetical protein